MFGRDERNPISSIAIGRSALRYRSNRRECTGWYSTATQTVRSLDPRIGKHRLGQGIAGRFTRALTIRKLQQLGMEQPVKLASDIGHHDEPPVSHPLRTRCRHSDPPACSLRPVAQPL